MKLSIAMPTFNGANYLSTQLDSILEQTRPPDEIIVYDDASDDGTVEIARSYERDHDAVEVYEGGANLGVAGNFKRALRACTGDVIALSDQDDVWRADKLEVQLDRFESSGGRLVTHDSRFLVDGEPSEETVWRSNLSSRSALPEGPRATFERLLMGNFVQGATMLFDADLRKRILPIPDSFLYDHWIALIASVTTGISAIDECYMLYRIHDDQAHGAARTPVEQLRREISRPSEAYREYHERWLEFERRLDEFDERELTVERDELDALVSDRAAYDRNRRVLHDASSSPGERLGAMYRSLSRGHYRRYSRLGLALVDGVRITRRVALPL